MNNISYPWFEVWIMHLSIFLLGKLIQIFLRLIPKIFDYFMLFTPKITFLLFILLYLSLNFSSFLAFSFLFHILSISVILNQIKQVIILLCKICSRMKNRGCQNSILPSTLYDGKLDRCLLYWNYCSRVSLFYSSFLHGFSSQNLLRL